MIAIKCKECEYCKSYQNARSSRKEFFAIIPTKIIFITIFVNIELLHRDIQNSLNKEGNERETNE